MSLSKSFGKMAKNLGAMQKEPASKEWFEKHGLPGKKKEVANKMLKGSGFSRAEKLEYYHKRSDLLKKVKGEEAKAREYNAKKGYKN